jgi:uncharacterized tellurite resistance protein B-like protein
VPQDRQSDSEALLAEMRAFFARHLSAAAETGGAPDPDHDPEAQLAAAALAIELCRADFEISDDERRAVERAVQGALGVPEERTRQLISLAEQQVRLGTRLHEFANLIDARFSEAQKRRVVELLWRTKRFPHRRRFVHREWIPDAMPTRLVRIRLSRPLDQTAPCASEASSSRCAMQPTSGT